MTETEKYKAGQEASGIEVGDTVRITRNWADNEMGCPCSCLGMDFAGKKSMVESICSDGDIDTGDFLAPYFVLEIVKKADGSVPDAKPITKGDSNMKTQEIYKYVVTESIKVKDDNGQIESNRKKILACGTMAAYDVENVKVKAMQGTKLEGVDLDEVEVLVRPFLG